MKHFKLTRDEQGDYQLRVDAMGPALLRDPLLNKGTAFTAEERRTFKLEGLLPNQYNTLQMQARRRYAAIAAHEDPFVRYVEMSDLQDRNEHLFYRVLADNLEALMPIVYTPTVGQATERYSKTYRRGRGVWITPDMKGRVKEVLGAAASWCDVSLLVVTDNESILGIGDQGAGGIAISVGKLSLYCAAGGIHPARTLPVSLDVGTNNKELLEDDLYLGWREPRLKGQAYNDLLAEFVAAVKEVFPGALVQWEDFRKDNALAILNRYREDVLSFNDDIQGTGAVAAAGVLGALRATGESIADQRILIYGAGAAGLGIARQLKAVLHLAGLNQDESRNKIAVLDSRGLLVDDRDLRDDYKKELAWSAAQAASVGLGDAERRDIHSVVKAFKPTVLIGSSGQAGAFDQALIQSMLEYVERPIVLPFSNPTSISEAKPVDLIKWKNGKVLVATGSPFDPVEHDGKTHLIGQGNNVFIFPGLGIGALICNARKVTDGMIGAASQALAEAVLPEELEQGLLFPAIPRLREVAVDIAAAVIKQAGNEGAGDKFDDAEIQRKLERHSWDAVYPSLVLDD
ncbi:MAG: NAD-dependent malic enzyme [Pseudomonadota bacterium]